MSKTEFWCMECWLVPVEARGAYCDNCRHAYWDDGVQTHGPWCAKCAGFAVAFPGDWCDNCLPPARKYHSANVHRPALPKKPDLPSVEAELTYLPARRTS
jgi:methionyl-tRNA synthetase